MPDRHRNSDLVEMGVDEYASQPAQEKPKAKPKKQKEEKPQVEESSEV